MQRKKKKTVTKIWNNTNIKEETRSMGLSQFIFVSEKLLIRSHQCDSTTMPIAKVTARKLASKQIEDI